MFVAASRMIADPVATLPVKLISPMSGCCESALPVVAPRPKTMLITPGGRSVSAISRAKINAFSGVSSLGLITIVLPVTSAGPAFRAMRKNGKFHGRMPATTPIGWRSKKTFSPGRSLEMTSPSIRRAHSAM